MHVATLKKAFQCPPNGQGITALMALGILETMREQGLVGNILEMEHNSAGYLHAIGEALRFTLTRKFYEFDSQYYVTDPDFQYVPLEELLDKHLELLQDYLASRAALFDPKRTNPQVIHGSLVQSSDTVYFSVTDRWGNACSYSTSRVITLLPYTDGANQVPRGFYRSTVVVVWLVFREILQIP
ncbi:nucleophile aminohydrolase [Lactifluus volemus]|nr:nucleophile aminohydrolase [Lactifluus volemus]